MPNTDEIIKIVEEQCGRAPSGDAAGVTADTVAEQAGIWRSDAVEALNALAAAGHIKRTGTRPVRYTPADQAADRPSTVRDESAPFSNMIGFNGSIKFQTQLACAAVSYPPNGIHTLIIGETGVGKSLMASEMARYLASVVGGPVPPPFIIFNCAEYADNPQLLLSQLFGHVRGAFTGADRDKPGLVEKADGGILFLDEIHRLPATGQEMLFTVVDKGLYRRLGDTVERRANFMIIGATTENPSSFLLGTFKRRMPLTIQIPVLRERPINERLEIISLFLTEEARRLNLPIRVSYLALKLFVSFRGENNIGDLKNEIRISCARSYLEYEREKQSGTEKPSLNIDIYDLSRKLSVNYVQDDRVDAYFSAVGLNEGMLVLPGQTKADRADGPLTPEDKPCDPLDFRTGIENRMFSYREFEENPEEAERRMVSDLRRQYASLGDTAESPPDSLSGTLYGSVAPVVWTATNELIRYAALEFNKSYEAGITNSIAYYLQQLKTCANAGRIIFSPSNFDNMNDCPKEYTFIRKMLPLLRSHLSIDIMDGEALLLAMLLAHETAGDLQPSKNLLLVGYGGIASGTAAFVNSMLNTNFVAAFDVPVDGDLDTNRFRLSSLLEQNGNDMLILSGLGVLTILEKALAKRSGRYCLIAYLDPMLALECGRMILTTNDGLDDIVDKLEKECSDYYGIDLRPVIMRSAAVPAGAAAEPALAETKSDMRDVIVTYCITGTGSARVAREVLLSNLTVSSTADVLALGIMDDIFSVARRLGKRLKLIIGIMNPNIPGIPFVSIEQILYSSNPDELLRTKGVNILTESEIEAQEVSRMSLDARLLHIGTHLNFFAPSLDAQQTDAAARFIVDNVKKLYGTDLPPDLVVRIYIHCATMFERLAGADAVPMPLDGYAVVEHNYELFDRLKETLNTGCAQLGLNIVDAEVYYLMMTLPNIGLS